MRSIGERKQAVLEWLNTPVAKRDPKTKLALAEKLGISTVTIFRYEHDLRNNLLYNGEKPAVVAAGASEEEKKNAFMEHLYKECMKPNPSAGNVKVLAQMLGMLVEKSETKVQLELSADEIARRNLKAERELREWGEGRGRPGHRVVEVQERPEVLPHELCLDSGQGRDADDEVATLAVPSGNS